MLRKMTLEELANEVMVIQRMDTTQRLQLINALAEYGIETQSNELITLSYSNYDAIFNKLHSRATVFSEDALNELRQVLIDNKLAHLLEKFVKDYVSGKYGQEDVERLYMVIESKLPEEISEKSISALVEADSNSAKQTTIESKIDEMEKEGHNAIDAVLLFYFSNRNSSEEIFKHVLPSFERRSLASTKQEVLDLIRDRIKALQTMIFEFELTESQGNEIESLEKALIASERAEEVLDSRYNKTSTTSERFVDTSEKSNVQNSIEEDSFFKRLTNGDIPLWKTYWLYGVLIGFFFNVIYQVTPSTTAFFVAVMFINVVWSVIILIGIWNSAGKYQGPAIWSVLAKIAVALGALLLLTIPLAFMS